MSKKLHTWPGCILKHVGTLNRRTLYFDTRSLVSPELLPRVVLTLVETTCIPRGNYVPGYYKPRHIYLPHKCKIGIQLQRVAAYEHPINILYLLWKLCPVQWPWSKGESKTMEDHDKQSLLLTHTHHSHAEFCMHFLAHNRSHHV